MDRRSDYARLKHRPPHDPTRGTALFVTAATHLRLRHLAPARRKDQFVDGLRESCSFAAIELIAFVVLDEHYHVVVRPDRPESFPAWIAALHHDSSSLINAEDGQPGRQVWYQHWDTSLWTEGDLWSRINYVHYNPVKHGYVTDAADWPWSSYRDLLAGLEPDDLVLRERYPAPRRLRNDDF